MVDKLLKCLTTMIRVKRMKRYKGYRFPIEVISSAIWSYYRLTASFRDIEMLLMQRGIEVSHETSSLLGKEFWYIICPSIKEEAS